jgi:putative oxidoreductase
MFQSLWSGFKHSSMKNLFYLIKQDIALLLLRISVGLSMFIAHGLPKFNKLAESTDDIKFYDFARIGAEYTLTIAVFTELICSGFLVLGFFTRTSALFLTATMTIAFFLVHYGDPFSKKEMAFLYLIIYVILLILGPGKFSVDYFVGRFKKAKAK